MKKLSKKQENILVILCEGYICQDVETNELSLEDGDSNSYYIRHDSLNILLKNNMVAFTHSPSIHVQTYGLTNLAKAYLLLNCWNDIKDFVQIDMEKEMTLDAFIQLSTAKDNKDGTWTVEITLKDHSKSYLTVDNCNSEYNAKERVFLFLIDKLN